MKEIFSKFKDNSRTNCIFLEFQEFSRTKVIFKDFSRSVRTLYSAQLLSFYLYPSLDAIGTVWTVWTVWMYGRMYIMSCQNTIHLHLWQGHKNFLSREGLIWTSNLCSETQLLQCLWLIIQEGHDGPGSLT